MAGHKLNFNNSQTSQLEISMDNEILKCVAITECMFSKLQQTEWIA